MNPGPMVASRYTTSHTRWMSVTTIKVSKALRDRIATRAAKEGTTLAEAIERALDRSDEEEFWTGVAEQNAHASAADYDEGGLRDDLHADASLGRDDW